MSHDLFLLAMPSALVLCSSFGCAIGDQEPNRGDRYVSKEFFARILESQTRMTPQTLAQLREHGVTDDTRLELEIFFYTDTKGKADALAASLFDLSYDVMARRSTEDDSRFLVNGWTVPIRMEERSVMEWTEKMCQLGYEHDCVFDGWGTYPTQ